MPTNIVPNLDSLIPVEFDNLAGTKVTPPAGAASATNDNPGAANATIETGADGSLMLVLSPIQPAQTGAVCNVSVTDGTITTPTVDFVIAADNTAANAHLDTADMTTRPQAAPGA
jgi:hypothetical protein